MSKPETEIQWKKLVKLIKNQLKLCLIKLSILDGYTDEPTCLGVPPYISPYPRYIAGAIRTHNKSIDICYITIDQLRKNKLYLDLLIKSD